MSVETTATSPTDFEIHPVGTGTEMQRLRTENRDLRERMADLREQFAKAKERLEARERRMGL